MDDFDLRAVQLGHRLARCMGEPGQDGRPLLTVTIGTSTGFSWVLELPEATVAQLIERLEAGDGLAPAAPVPALRLVPAP